MKISKPLFLRVLAKHISLKLNNKYPNEQELSLMTASLTPLLNVNTPKLRASGILDDNQRIDITKLEEEANNFFQIIPVINIPVGSTSLPIKKVDVDKFITELFSKGEVDEVIYLPYN